jgi:diaminohydroxyphosphoribosylaminopyrimidine deaminase/5-amino-6-(5-phosphoribosylamino)uracil reductase
MLFLVFMDDSYYMKRALSLAKRARGRTSPNPMVGAVLVKAGRIVAENYHRKAGQPHAEALVLDAVGGRAAGATLYVTLEPCCHVRKRTPPCTRTIMDSGVGKVVVAMQDPNPKVSGRGIKKLMDAGIRVSVGLFEERARALNEAYTKYITRGLPFVILKTAMTLDGKIATATGQSKWITGEKARRLVHRVRSDADAVVTAIGTVVADDPQLTARIRGGSDPLRVVIDPLLRIPPGAKILKTPPGTIVVTKTENRKSAELEARGIMIIRYSGRLDLKWLMKRLADMQITSVLVEGGSALNAHALDDAVVDRVMFFVAPKIIGGKESFTPVGGSGRLARSLEDAYQVRNVRVRRVGEDMLVEGDV